MPHTIRVARDRDDRQGVVLMREDLESLVQCLDNQKVFDRVLEFSLQSRPVWKGSTPAAAA
ncbi:MAG: hypothetical protein M3O22_06095 [Pseudomonadota bacterium]|nr:hypothetical protein [Pseudomonadota bacterium]